MPNQSPKHDPNKIEASPTKDLFITMLIKDITVRDAIGDLIDNSVDAVKKNYGNITDWSPFKIDIKVKSDHFEIIDNCGGLDAEVARSSAFCFGKPKDYKIGTHTIGQFGIGMKRAFFKIGNYIEVKSRSKSSTFKMHINVPIWREQNVWDFKFDELSEKEKNNQNETYTNINISDLNQDIKEKFVNNQFVLDLQNEIALEHLYSINKGLKIYINDHLLKSKEINLINDPANGISPAYWKHIFKSSLEAEILAGVAEDNGKDGGWYIFCNDRLILGPDTTEKTGWTGSGGKEMPKYHDQFFRFRGYVFFNANDSSLLPWNTTKTGMDMDSPEFLFVRTQMIIIAKQVKKLMDDMKKERERDNPEPKRTLSNTVKNAIIEPVFKVLANKSSLPFVYKYPENLINVAKRPTKGIKITFQKSDASVQKVKLYFKVDDANKAGELAFDYFYENEIGE